MRVNFKPTSVIEARLGIQEGGPAHKFFTDRCYAHMDKYVPYKPHQGDHLRENVELGVDYIKYSMPYASYQYYGVRQDGTHEINNHTTSGTTTYWDREMWSIEKDDVVSEVQNYVDTHGGR